MYVTVVITAVTQLLGNHGTSCQVCMCSWQWKSLLDQVQAASFRLKLHHQTLCQLGFLQRLRDRVGVRAPERDASDEEEL